MTAKEVSEQLGKLIADVSEDPDIVQILNEARIRLRNLIPQDDTAQSFMV